MKPGHLKWAEEVNARKKKVERIINKNKNRLK